MEFAFQTAYHQKACTAMARALRKTVRKKRSRRSHVFGWIVMGLGLLLTIYFLQEGGKIQFKNIVSMFVLLCLLAVLIWEDALNGYIARKRMLKGTGLVQAVFQEEGYFSETELGKSEWKYDKIIGVAETRNYFVFIFSQSHAQVYDKNSLAGGSVSEFCVFIEEKTGRKIQKV